MKDAVLQEDLSAEQQRGKQLYCKIVSRQWRPSVPGDEGLQQEACRENREGSGA